MIFPAGAMTRTSPEGVDGKTYDAVIVGGGISGAIIANELSQAGKSVLIIEAGPGKDKTLSGYEEYLALFYGTAAKDNQSPYPVNANAPMPRSSDARPITPGTVNAGAYIVQNGPFSTDTTYTRVLGGTTMHWEAKILRMLPEDFEMRTKFNQSENWPDGLKYKDLEPYYERAEEEMGVSADIEDQEYLDLKYRKGYVFPMKRMPPSYLDKMVAKGIDGTTVKLDGETYPLQVRSFPQARNGIVNPLYKDKDGKGYVPVGAVSTNQVEEGARCQGNNNCVPICPVQAKYHAGKTLAKALQTGKVDVLPQSVASQVLYDSENGHVTGIQFKTYKNATSPDHETGIAKGRIYVLSANAIENPRLMLASRLPNENGLIGRNLMDHAYLLSWALMPEVCGTMRGTNCTSGIVDLRGGSFRSNQAAFSVDIHNDGWGWPKGSPLSDLVNLVDSENQFGAGLKRAVADRVTRQLLLAFMIEVLPSQSNRVSVDPAYTDQLGNMRPVISYHIPEYTMRGVAYARQFARTMFARLGADDHTAYDDSDYGYVTYEGHGYAIRGGNHLAGTHMLGSHKSNSVVNLNQRAWNHKNLYVVGGGSMPTIGTANVTNTIVALCYISAKDMLKQLS
jgi:choline dehydrogenase-like flavoprotein